MLLTRSGESQRGFVRRILTERGQISVQDVLYGMQDDNGRPRSITRLAAIVHDLRHDEGWGIDEKSPGGGTATYTLVRAGTEGRVVAPASSPVSRAVCPKCAGPVTVYISEPTFDPRFKAGRCAKDGRVWVSVD
jgi:hypothetical protein